MQTNNQLSKSQTIRMLFLIYSITEYTISFKTEMFHVKHLSVEYDGKK